MQVERKVLLNGMTRRTDVVIYNKEKRPVMICECKAPGVKLSQTVMDQAARYNITLQVPFLLISNGTEHFCCSIDVSNKLFSFLSEIPKYQLMCEFNG